MTSLARRSVTALALTALAGGLAAVAAPPGAAATTFSAVATAKAVSGQLSNPDQLPLGAVVETSGQSAQATLDQLGTSAGFASHPYPGDFVVGVPGLLNGAGSPVPVPDYPLYVASDKETNPEAKASGPGFSLEALSKDGSTTAEAIGAVGDTDAFRTGRGRAQAETTEAADGTVTAVATTEVDSVSVAGLLRFGRVSTQVTVKRSPSGALTRESSLAAEGVAVAGQSVALVDGQLLVAGTKQPLPETPLGGVLKQAGISVTTTAPTDTEDGRDGGALVVTVVNERDDTGTTTATYRIGGAAAFVAFGVSPDPATGGDGGFSNPDAPVAGGDVSLSAPGVGAEPFDTGAFAAAPEALTGDEPLAAAPDAEAPAVSAPQQTLRQVRNLLPARSDIAWLYFAFVACAMALFGSGQVLRQYGVKAGA